MKNNLSQFDEVEKALRLFPYFDLWNKKTIMDCCRLTTIKVVPPGGIVLDWEEQESVGVHFIMEGTCKLIEHLSLVAKKGANGGMKYTIFHGANIDDEIGADDEPKYSSLLFNMGSTTCLEKGSRVKLESKIDEEYMQFVENHHSPLNEEPEVAFAGVTDGADDATEQTCVATECSTRNDGIREVNYEKSEKSEVKSTSRFSQFYRRMRPYQTAKNRIFFPKSDSTIESHFLQIALIHKGCCLGLGENLYNRYLVSVTEVTCMVIPLQFLLQHNPNNIWNRIKQFLNDYLPKEEKVLSEFVLNKRWNECKRKLVASKVRRK